MPAEIPAVHSYDPTAEAEYLEAITGDTAETLELPMSVPVTVTDPVRITPEAPRSFVTVALALSAALGALQLVGPHPTRTRLVISNTGPVLVFVAGSPQLATASSGYGLPAGQQLVITSRDAVYVSGADTAACSALAEYTDGA